MHSDETAYRCVSAMDILPHTIAHITHAVSRQPSVRKCIFLLNTGSAKSYNVTNHES